jgi:hypothetical protein
MMSLNLRYVLKNVNFKNAVKRLVKLQYSSHCQQFKNAYFSLFFKQQIFKNAILDKTFFTILFKISLLTYVRTKSHVQTEISKR